MLNKLEAAMQLANCSPDSIVRSQWTVLVKYKAILVAGEECFFHFAGRVLNRKRTVSELHAMVDTPTAEARADLIKAALIHYYDIIDFRAVLDIEPYRESRCVMCSRTRVGPKMRELYGPTLYRNYKREVRDGE